MTQNTPTIASILETYKSSKTALLSTISATTTSNNTTATTTTTTPNNNNNTGGGGGLYQTAASHLLSLKSCQRTACLLLESRVEDVKRARAKVDAGRQLLENLAYERDNFLKQIEFCRGLETAELERMAREEMGVDDAAGGTTTTTTTTEGEEEGDGDNIINSFLLSHVTDDDDGTGANRDYRHDQWHESNLKKLNFEVEERRRLLDKLTRRRDELSRDEASLRDKHKFLKELPSRLAAVEKATLPLQDYFATGAAAGGSCATGRAAVEISSERKTRVRLAKDLSGALYTLCSQVQGFVDAFRDEEVVIGIGEVSSAEEEEKGVFGKSVTLEFRVAGCAAANVITLEFRHDGVRDIVTVLASGKGIDSDFLLYNVFPDDTGENTPNVANYSVGAECDGSKRRRRSYGKPYLWAQYLAGLYFLPATTSSSSNDDPTEKLIKMGQNTAAILTQLKRRIRSHLTLYQTLRTLQNNKMDQIPISPQLANIKIFPTDTFTTHVTSWTPLPSSHSSSSSPPAKHYRVKFKKHQSFHVFEACVKITPEYPAVAPFWTAVRGGNTTLGGGSGTTTGSNAGTADASSSTSFTKNTISYDGDDEMLAKVNSASGLMVEGDETGW
eukprot:CAMPEP_0172505366 /NCGR_PEP_ID=MMETSP1066-20121228/185898_1 /TAXON_ID=671091 /ORGANISM="Coscinodiscus wailesii, Strain CCMP2513" /LENGTH=613 /DNA_ID=CAMNT_0013281945 /DNA_START=194 /DNA_END=2032 /DNA_ORIENTATION=+